MMRVAALAAFLFALGGCAANAPPCYVELGVGVWTDSDGIPGHTPSEANAYCTRGRWSAGFYHRSDIGRAWPFNAQEESSTDALFIKYRKRVF